MKKTEAYRTPDNDSDSATTENTKTITKMARLQQLKINYQKTFFKGGKKINDIKWKNVYIQSLHIQNNKQFVAYTTSQTDGL